MSSRNKTIRERGAGPGFLVPILCVVTIATAEISVTSSTYLGGSGGNEAVVGTAIQTDGAIVLAVNLDQSSVGGKSAASLNNASSGDMGTIIRLSTDGRTVKSVVKVGPAVADMCCDGNDNIYVALVDEGAVKLNPGASTVVWSDKSMDAHRIDAGPSGFCAVLGGKSDTDFGGLHRLRIFAPDGALTLDRAMKLRGCDVALSEKSRSAFITGFTIEFITGHEYHLAFYQSIAFNGAVRYTGYNWKAEDWAGNNPYEHTRPLTCGLGDDGYLYVPHAWTGRGYNCLTTDPFDRSRTVSLYAGDDYQNLERLRQGEEGDSKKKLFVYRYEPSTGNFIAGSPFAPISNSGPNMVAAPGPGAIRADSDGTVYIAGSSAAGLPLPPAYLPESGEQTYNPLNLDYRGGPFLLVLSSDFSKRIYLATMGKDAAYTTCAIRRLNGNTVVVAGGYDKKGTFYTKNAVQASRGGGQDAVFSVWNSPGNSSGPAAPSNLRVTARSATATTVSWDDNSDNEDGFRIERKRGAGSFSQIATVPTGAKTFLDHTVRASTGFIYRVAAFNLAGQSSYSNRVSVTPPAPSLPSAPANLAAAHIEQTSLELNWRDGGGAEGFIVEMKKQGAEYFEAVAECEQDEQTFAAGNLSAGMQYACRVRAFNADGYSPYSSEIHATTQDLALQESQSVSGLSSGVCYDVFKKPEPLGEWPDFSSLEHNNSGTSSNFNPVENSTLAENYAIQYSGYMNIPSSGTYTFTLNLEKAGQLYIDDILVVDNDSWKWGPFTTSGQVGLKAGMHSFVLDYMFTYPKGNVPVLDVFIEGPAMTYRELPESMLYHAPSCPLDRTPPATPSGLSASVVSGTQVRLQWDTMDNVSGYLIDRNVYGWNTYDEFKTILKAPGDTTTFINENLTPQTEYRYKIRAFNAFGISDFTPVVQATTNNQATALHRKQVTAGVRNVNMITGSRKKSVRIAYCLDKSLPVAIDIFTCAGKKAATLCREEREPGRHEISWTDTGMPLPGAMVYLVRFSTPAFSRVFKVIGIRSE
ncbi:MAG: hypothetical protein GF350_11220 [Chitinivibrionales bacterium]|nr:hypothetical protein [Chitinivibrionales bacterium]